MKITIEIPDLKLNEFTARELFDRLGIIPKEYSEYWTNSFIEKDGFYILKIEGIVDGELDEKEFSMKIDDFGKHILESVNHFEYSGRYGTKMAFSTDEKPDYYTMKEYYRTGSLNEFLKELISKSIENEFSYGYIE